jgi:hypothetical protein
MNSTVDVEPCELRFESLFHPGRALSFPCDTRGQVSLDALSDRARQNYLYARALMGREYATPAVVRRGASIGPPPLSPDTRWPPPACSP